MSDERRVSAGELQRRGEQGETVRALCYDLADRVYWWQLDQTQDADIVLLTRARALGWVPWYEREPELSRRAAALAALRGEGGDA